MTSYTDVFSNSLVPGAEVSFASYTLTTNAQFQWPYNYSGTDNTLANSNEISCSAGVTMTMPAASEVSNGETVIIKNIGSETLTIVKSDASALTTVAAGVTVYLQISDNTDEGVWSVTTFGTGTSAADATTLAGYGVTAIGSVLNAAYPTETHSGGWTIDQYDRAKVFIFTGGSETCSLSTVSDFGTDFFCMIRNSGTGSLMIDPYLTETIDDGTVLTLNPGESVILTSTGTEWYTIGYGRSMVYQFTQLIYSVVAGDQTLTATEASNKLLTFIGSPVSAATITVPSVVSIYYVHNDLSTAQSVVIETATGLGAVVGQGQRAIVFCDGTDVLAAQTAEITGDVTMTDGTYSSPSLAFSSQTNTGFYKNGTYGLGVAVNGTSLVTIDPEGLTVNTGYLKIPSDAAPSQIEEGAFVFNTSNKFVTVGTGSGSSTLITGAGTQTLTNKTLTSPVISGGTWTLPAGTGSTINGVVQWSTGGLRLTVGDGAGGYKTMVDVNSTQTLTNKTLTSPTITAPTITSPSITGTTEYNNEAITELKTASFNGEVSASGTSGTVTCNFSNGQKMKVVPGGAITSFALSFPGVGHYQLRIAMGTLYTITWTFSGVNAYALESSDPVVAANKSTFVNFFYDGADCFYSRSQQV